MRPLRWLTLAAVLSSPAWADPPAVAASDAPTQASAQAPARLPKFGLKLDLGVPDGAALSFLFRPLSFVRLEAGIAYLASPAVHAGLTLIPFNFPVTPTLGIEVAHVFPGGLNPYALKAVSKAPPGVVTLLQSMQYNYVNAHLGLEMGSPQAFLFFIKGGLTYLDVQTAHFQELLQATTNDQTLTAGNPVIRAIVPSVKLGFVIYFG